MMKLDSTGPGRKAQTQDICDCRIPTWITRLVMLQLGQLMHSMFVLDILQTCMWP